VRRVAETLLGLVLALGAVAASQAQRTDDDAAPAPSAAPSASAPAPTSPPPDARSDPAPTSARLPAARGEHAEHVADYTLRVSLDAVDHMLRGEGTITWRNPSRVAQRELWLHLYWNGFKNVRTLLQRTSPVPTPPGGYGYIDVERFFVREMDADLWERRDRFSPGDAFDETDIRVPLPREVQPGETIHVDVAWTSKIPALTLRTGYAGAFHMIAQWFPKLARIEPDGQWKHFPFHYLSEFYSDFGLYDVTLDVPIDHVVGSTGMLTDESRSGSRQERRYVQEDIHDFAFASWEGFRLLEQKTEDGVTVKCFYPPGQYEVAAAEVAAARFGLRHFGERYGKYPYGKLVLVHPPPNGARAGGMEYPMLVTTGGPWYGPLLGARYAELVTLHELAHQWFYGIVATDEHTFPFLDEGLTSYAEAEAIEAWMPSASLFRGLGVSVGGPAWHRVSALAFLHEASVAAPAESFSSRADYGSVVYHRTSTILGTIARVHGEEGVRSALGTYARRHRFAHPGPEDLIAAFREALGDDVARTLEQALFERGWIDLAIEHVETGRVAESGGIFGDPREPREAPHVEGHDHFRTDIMISRGGSLVFPVEVELGLADGNVERVRFEPNDPLGRLTYTGKSRVVSAVIDPERRVLLDADLTNNAWSVDPSSLAPRVLERAAFAGGVILGLGAP
jgi:hypothetical protein